MTTQEAMTNMEDFRFSAVANLASDFNTFLDILADQPEIKQLLLDLKNDAMTLAIYRRVLQLAASNPDSAFEHPDDVAMAAYLWLLSKRIESLEYATDAAAAVLRCAQCWWSRKMAEQIQNRSRFNSSIGLNIKANAPAPNELSQK